MKIFLMILVMAFSSSAAFGEMYTWKDAKGTSFYTNDLNEIPARYLKRARILDMATGKKGGPATAHPGVVGDPAVSAGQAAAPQPRAQQPDAAAAVPEPAIAAPAPARVAPAAEVSPPRPQQRSTLKQRSADRRRSSHRSEE